MEENKNYEKNLKDDYLNKVAKIISNYNINFLLGSGCSYYKENENYLGFPIMSDFSLEINKLLKKYYPNLDFINELDKNSSFKFENGFLNITQIENFIDHLKKKEELNFEFINNLKKSIIEIINKPLKWYESDNQKKVMDFYSNLSYLIKSFQENFDFNSHKNINKKINIFNLNYDLFCEFKFDELGLQYNDGFEGKINRVFNANEFNNTFEKDGKKENLINLVKIHGSIDWVNDQEKRKIVRKGFFDKEDNLDRAMVMPTSDKYLDVFQNHIFSMQQFFKSSIYNNKNILFVIGTSLSDEHIKDIIITSSQRNNDLIIIIFSYSESEFYEWKGYKNIYICESTPIDAMKKMMDIFFYNSNRAGEIENND
ncbi:SIR2 family protein [Spiroplasma endosymbiont of Diplazon laetatorius]|uniref:SIR2 family protein n=1 Tax=Spiroplasma endosymbiont of Diplazon laetatorius TaxID=3066322 RepID=UPI0030CDD1AE